MHAGFNIDSLLGGHNKFSSLSNSTDFLHNSDSAFTNLSKESAKDIARMDELRAMASRAGHGLGVTPAVSVACMASHQHKDSDYCSQCFDSSSTNISDNLLNSMRPYEMSTQNLTNINNINTRNLMRTAGLSSNPWSLIDTNNHMSAIQPHDIRSHSNMGNIGLKFHNSLVQFDNLSSLQSIQNIPSISNSYSPFSSLYAASHGQGQFGTQVGSSRVEHGVTGPAFTWPSTRGAGFLTSRCPDTGLFMPSYRKHKRVRTAFSPTQLLRLEHAFEKNHYVVGQERKELSASLNLSETQVKVWFQNRRTKHKRMVAEDDMTSSYSRRNSDDRDDKTPSLEDVVIDA